MTLLWTPLALFLSLSGPLPMLSITILWAVYRQPTLTGLREGNKWPNKYRFLFKFTYLFIYLFIYYRWRTTFSKFVYSSIFCQQLGLNCAVTAGSRVSQSRGADDRASVGSEVWLCRSELNAGIGMGKISVLGYSRGRCYHKKVNICENAMLIFNLVWVCQTGLGKGSDSRVSSSD